MGAQPFGRVAFGRSLAGMRRNLKIYTSPGAVVAIRRLTEAVRD
jgi:hypothetical protein